MISTCSEADQTLGSREQQAFRDWWRAVTCKPPSTARPTCIDNQKGGWGKSEIGPDLTTECERRTK